MSVCVCVHCVDYAPSVARPDDYPVSKREKNYLPTTYWSRKCIFLLSSSLFKVMSIRIATWSKEPSKLPSELKMKGKKCLSIFEDGQSEAFEWEDDTKCYDKHHRQRPCSFFFLHPVCLVCLVFRRGEMKNTPGWTPAVNNRRETKPPRANHYSFLSDESSDLWPQFYVLLLEILRLTYHCEVCCFRYSTIFP